MARNRFGSQARKEASEQAERRLGHATVMQSAQTVRREAGDVRHRTGQFGVESRSNSRSKTSAPSEHAHASYLDALLVKVFITTCAAPHRGQMPDMFARQVFGWRVVVVGPMLHRQLHRLRAWSTLSASP